MTPSLQLTVTEGVLLLKFSNEYGAIFNKYKNSTTVVIQDLSNSSFNYSINQVSSETSNDNFQITLNYSLSFSNKPLLTLSIIPPESIINDQSNNLHLSITTLQINLDDHYELDANSKALVADTNTATNALNDATSSAFAANNLMSTGGSFAFRSLISMDVIRFLRFFLVNYPPNALAMFQTSIPTSDLIPNVNIQEEEADGKLPDIFSTYDLSIYIFNNNGNALIETLTYLSVGVATILILKVFLNTTNRYFRLALLLLRMIFVWNYAISYFLSTFMNFCLTTFLSYRYPTTTTNKGKFNFIFSIITGFILIYVLLFCVKIIRRLRSNLDKIDITKRRFTYQKKLSEIENDQDPQRFIDNVLNEPESAGVFKNEHLSAQKIHGNKVPFNGSSTLPPVKEISFSAEQENHEIPKDVKNIKFSKILNNFENSPTHNPANISFGDEKTMDVGHHSFSKGAISPQSRLFYDNKNMKTKDFDIGPFQPEKSNKEFNKIDEDFKKKDLLFHNLYGGNGDYEKSNVNYTEENYPYIPELEKTSPRENNDNIIKLRNLNSNGEFAGKPSDNSNDQILDKKSFIPSVFRKLSQRFAFIGRKAVAPFDDSMNINQDNWLVRLKAKVNNVLNTKKEKKSMNTDEIGRSTKKLEILNKRFYPLHKDFNQARPTQSYYLVLDLLRQCLFSMIVVMLFDKPLIGLIIVNIINISYFAIFIVIRPFKERQDFIQSLFNEICLILCSISALILIIMEVTEINDLDLRLKLGWVMVGANSFLIVVFLFRILISFSVMGLLLIKMGATMIIGKFCKKKNRVDIEGVNGEKRKKSAEGEVLQKIVDIENFLR